MKWHLIVLAFFFIVFLSVSVYYANKSEVVYNVSSVERIDDGNGVWHSQEVVRTHYDNYGSIGGAIGFAILSAASLLVMVKFTVDDKKGNESALSNPAPEKPAPDA